MLLFYGCVCLILIHFRYVISPKMGIKSGDDKNRVEDKVLLNMHCVHSVVMRAHCHRAGVLNPVFNRLLPTVIGIFYIDFIFNRKYIVK